MAFNRNGSRAVARGLGHNTTFGAGFLRPVQEYRVAVFERHYAKKIPGFLCLCRTQADKSPNGSSGRRGRLVEYESKRKNDIEYWEENDPTRVQTKLSKDGVALYKYVTRTTFEFVDAYETEALARAAHNGAYGDVGNAVPTSGASTADRQFLTVFVTQVMGEDDQPDLAALRTLIDNSNLPFELDGQEVLEELVFQAVSVNCSSAGKVDLDAVDKWLKACTLTDHLTSEDEIVQTRITEFETEPF